MCYPRHACEWGEFNPSGGNLAAINPEPQVVEYTTEARRMLFERRQHWDKVGDDADEWQPLWARTGEKACRLALIYAASRGIENLRIDTPAVEWACEVADYTTRLFQSRGNDCIADTEFEGQCQRTLRAIAGKKSTGCDFRQLCMHRCWRGLKRPQRMEILTMLHDRGDVITKDGRYYAVSELSDAAMFPPHGNTVSSRPK